MFPPRLPKSQVLTGLAYSFALLLGIQSQTSAQTVTTTGDIPYAKSLAPVNGSLEIWTLSQIRKDKDYTVNPGGNTVMEKDIRSRSGNLGYSSPQVENAPSPAPWT